MNAVRLDPIGLSYYPSDAGGRALSPGERRVVLFGDSRALMWKEPTVPNLQFVNLGIGNQTTEQIQLGLRELYVYYPSGQGDSKLKIPAAKSGTARNMNTVAKLAEMARDL